MSHTPNTKVNKLDKYLIVFKDTGETYEEFRTIGGANIFLDQHTLKNDLEIIKNPKYLVTPDE